MTSTTLSRPSKSSKAFRAQAASLRDGEGLARFVEQEFRDFLGCACLASGFARFHCDGCGLDRLVPFSCKGRGFCPSCGGRRMAPDAWSEDAPVLAGLAAASVQGRVALGPRAGARVERHGDAPDGVEPITPGPCHAQLGGFDLHARNG